jgi:hypothetical protein
VYDEEEEEESELVIDKKCATDSDSWSDEEVDKTELSEIATKAMSSGRTVRTRRDGPIDEIDFE